MDKMIGISSWLFVCKIWKVPQTFIGFWLLNQKDLAASILFIGCAGSPNTATHSEHSTHYTRMHAQSSAYRRKKEKAAPNN